MKQIPALSLHRPRSRVSTVPCIPAGPKSCLVRKMAWSWYSAWSGSSRCCVLAHRHTCSRLRDGLPRSIRLMDCGRHGEQSANCRGAADDLQSDTNQLMFGKSMPVLFLVRGPGVDGWSWKSFSRLKILPCKAGSCLQKICFSFFF